MTHEKIFKILLSTTLALILVILGVGYVFYYKYLDQVTLQHDNEQICGEQGGDGSLGSYVPPPANYEPPVSVDLNFKVLSANFVSVV